METVGKTYEIVVIGGGLAGVCAALAAARSGCRTALIQNRPVLGGNSSSEIRVSIGGSDIDFLWARETGIIEELRIEDRYRNRSAPCNRNGHVGFMWDIVLYEKVKAEKNLDLFLNTSAQEALTDAAGKIILIKAVQIGTEKSFEFNAELYIDASGDGNIAAEAGAEFMYGREDRDTFGESLAPEKADAFTMGSSILFKAIDMGRPIPFERPGWAYYFPTDDDIPKGRNHSDIKGGFFWIEAGGVETKTITDNEGIRDELLKIVFGIWDHIKNHGDHGAANYALDWVGALPGKRESRRFYGDYVMSQRDFEEVRQFDDVVAYAGWPLDIHSPDQFHSGKCISTLFDLPARIGVPWRCLYSRNIPNLLFAGRNLSASHIACGTIRVMATCAITGQAAGTGAAWCIKHGIMPSGLSSCTGIKEVQQQLLRDDCDLVGIFNTDTDDLARSAKIAASSEQAFSCPESNFEYDLCHPHAALVPVSECKLQKVFLPLRSTLEHDVKLTVHLIHASKEDRFKGEGTFAISRTHDIIIPQWIGTFADETPVADAQFMLPAAYEGEVQVILNTDVEPGECYWLILDKAPGVLWKGIEEHPHHDQFHQSCKSKPVGAQAIFHTPKQGWVRYRRSSLNLRMIPEAYPYSPENVNNGLTRPDLWPNLWVSDVRQAMPQWIELKFLEAQELAMVQIIFDTNLDILVENDPVPAECVKDYSLMALINGEWDRMVEVKNNHQRLRRHFFVPVKATALRLEITATHGDPSARVYEIRAYAKSRMYNDDGTACAINNFAAGNI